MDTTQQKFCENPKKSANFISVMFFWWTRKLFKLGFSHPLKEENLIELLTQDESNRLGTRLQSKWDEECQRAKMKNKVTSPSLLKAIIATFKWEMIKLASLEVLNDLVLRPCQPILLGLLLQYFNASSTQTLREAFLYAGGIVIIVLLNLVLTHQYYIQSFHLGMQARVACCSLIYRKTLLLSQSALKDTRSGQVVNLLSNDVRRFDRVFLHVNFMFATPIAAVIIGYFLWLNNGIAGLAGITSVIVIVLLQSYSGKLFSKLRSETANKTDSRVKLMSEIIAGIKVIKMYAWERPFSKKVASIRRDEISSITKASIFHSIFMMLQFCTARIGVCGTVTALVLLGSDLSVHTVFTTVAYFGMLAVPLAFSFVLGIADIAETLVSIRRIQEVLLYDEFKGMRCSNNSKNHQVPEISVRISKLTTKWSLTSEENALSNISLQIEPGKLVAIIGQVGSGKSSLLQAILGEMPISNGSCIVNGRMSYACQEAWVFGATVRQNIVFGSTFDEKRYQDVVNICALQPDFNQFPNGDMTVVGERGTSLSGGQKARVNLARAVYNNADIYLIDDPLSSVDTHIGKHLFENCILSYLSKKTRILVTHQLQYLQAADHIIVLNNGKIEMQGTYEEVISSQLQYAQFLVQKEREQQRTIIDEDTSELKRKISIIQQLSHQMECLNMSKKSDDKLNKTAEEALTPAMQTVDVSLFVTYFKYGGNCCMLLCLIIIFVVAQLLTSGTDYWLSYWMSREDMIQSTGTSDIDMNKTYQIADPLNIGSSSTITNTHFDTYHGTSILNYFTSLELNTLSSLYIFLALLILQLCSAIIACLSLVFLCIRCSKKLHNSMLKALMWTKLDFFTINSSGRIINRFSKDLGSVDEMLPTLIVNVAQIFMMSLGSMILGITINCFFIILMAFVCIGFWCIGKLCLKTSSSLKKLEGTMKSPLFTHLNATINGLTTIRAYGAQEILITEFDKHQDAHTSAWFMYLNTRNAYGFFVDLLCFIYIAAITFTVPILGQGSFGGKAALAITQSMNLTALVQFGMKQFAEVVNEMTSVERVIEYTQLEEEPMIESPKDNVLPASWPNDGRIEFKNMYLRYTENDKPVLQDVNLTIIPREKVGIVGRTGAGKSSLMSALLRFTWIDGSVKIDGIDTKNIGLQVLRKKIAVIPQDPVLFSGSLRDNLDPFMEYPDSALWDALDQVELRETLAESHGLNTQVAEGGSNFSIGQRQLLCLARAILRNNKILVMDEATANVDFQTDALIQKTIREKFTDSTVLTIAHRLNTIMDGKKVIVMDSGRVVEHDHPYLLLQNKGHFYNMVQKTGKVMAEKLTEEAKMSYMQNIEENEEINSFHP